MGDAQMADPDIDLAGLTPKHAQHGVERRDVAAGGQRPLSDLAGLRVSNPRLAAPMACRIASAVWSSSVEVADIPAS